MIYVSYEERKKALKEQASLDMISQMELQAAVDSATKLDARACIVAQTISNLLDDVTDWGEREWHVSTVQLVTPARGTDREPECYVTLVAYAREGGPLEQFLTTSSRAHGADEYDTIVRRVNFPTRYLYTDGWLPEVADRARQVAIRMAEYRLKDMPEAVARAEAHVVATKARQKELEDKLAALKEDA